jgi:lipopolysaccharide/colanic/teichoic acid biosynthesis glycosyltransferase
MDYALGGILGILAAPVLAAVMLAVKLTSRGPAIYAQRRLGLRGRPYTIYKVRTMYPDCERQTGPRWAERNDPRVTPVGRLLRWTHLDELPQLWNVLRGEMSLVGPRPLQLRDSDRLLDTDPEAYHQRLQVLPGVTGPWQIGGRSELHYAHMVDLDLHYVQNWSLARDLWIICKTFLVVMRGKGAY